MDTFNELLCIWKKMIMDNNTQNNKAEPKAETPVVLFKKDRYVSVEDIIGLEIFFIPLSLSLHCPMLANDWTTSCTRKHSNEKSKQI